MDIKEASNILHEYYSESDLHFLYIRKKFDGSESDTNKELEYNAELLRKEALKTSDENEQERLYAAASVFERVAREAWFQK